MLHQDYKYPLTRVCLREGQMTLTRRLLEVFPSEGDITAVDSETGENLNLHMADARTVQGLTPFYKKHHLDVNDKLLIRLQDAHSISLTPLRKARQSDYSRPETIANMLDYIAENNTPLSEAEIRDIFPDLPVTLDLHALLKEDGRFARREGRWRLAEPEMKARDPLPIKIDEEVIANPFPFAEEEKAPAPKNEGLPQQRPIIKGSEWRKQHKVDEVPTAAEVVDGVDSVLGLPVEQDAVPDYQPATVAGDNQHDDDANPLPSALHSFNFQELEQPTTHPDQTMAEEVTEVSASQAVTDDASDNSHHISTTLTAEDATDATDVLTKIVFPGDVNVPTLAEDAGDVEQSLSQRVMWLLSQVGYTLEPLNTLSDVSLDNLEETQQFLVHAPLGEHGYSVLIHLHPSHARLDWAGLLARRRETAADYLSVFGDAEDLHRLHSPAELARATLWSWKGVERLEGASQALALSPLDLEDYFAKYGLFEYGLEHFQKASESRISERGYFSTVLRQLARLEAPCSFSLADLQEDSNAAMPDAMPETKRTAILHTLSQPPFELVVPLDENRYSLRQPIAQALTALSDYANSLKAHIAKQAKERASSNPSSDSAKHAAPASAANETLIKATPVTNDEALLNAARLSA